MRPSGEELPRLETGIRGLDLISAGGLPEGRTTLVSGTAGSSKTVFAVQFLARGILDKDEPGVFVTFEELPEDIRHNVTSFDWPISEWEAANKWRFVDVTADYAQDVVVAGNYDFGALIARIEHAIKETGAKRVSIDSIGGLFTQFDDARVIRKALFHIGAELKRLGVTAILTSERVAEDGPVARFGVEDFVSDNVIILRNLLEVEKRRKTIEILKLRGARHQKGTYPFTILPDEGMVVLPMSAVELKQKSSDERISCGVDELDEMCGGGFFRDSICLVSGATGTGKTLTSTHFIKAGVDRGESCLLLAFEESREQLIRNARGWGIDFIGMEKSGLLTVEGVYPGSASLEDHLIRIKDRIEEIEPRRVVVDSLSALEHASTIRSFREFVSGVTAYLKEMDISGLLTSTTPTLFGGPSITESHISTITDTIILLRYVETFGHMRRGITVLKMRGSTHEKDIREYTIDGDGMHIGSAFRNVSGILTGAPTHHTIPEEVEAFGGMFSDEDPG